MKIRSLEVDIDKGILKINGKNVEDPMMVTGVKELMPERMLLQ